MIDKNVRILKKPINMGDWVARCLKLVIRDDGDYICVIMNHWRDCMCSHSRIFSLETIKKYGINLEDYYSKETIKNLL